MRTGCIAQGTGKEIQGRGYTHSHTWLIHFAVWQKLTQDCKATVLQCKYIYIYRYYDRPSCS